MNQAPPGRRAGLIMLTLFWVLALGTGTWVYQGVLDGQRNPNTHLVHSLGDGDGSITLERNRAGHFVATGRINGEPVDFLLDTGATYVAVPAHLAERLGLPREHRATFNTANGRVQGHLTTLDDVRLGDLSARGVRGAITPGLEGDFALLGMSYLGRFDIQIRGSTMVLQPPQ
ncbi:MAG: TIGR02281 family clan AA aspartic protease [Chromatiaceae bacterium]|nr:MAG: TIGR02281 family clan AA aspartic protease [Chromatiaceae bacterium]